ncbi:MAG: LemA family protein [Candidatus Pacearchaeota archaeon]|jgi:LemA protein
MAIETLTIIILAIAALLGVLVIMFIFYYNRFTVLENRIDNSLAQIDVQLKKRADLIPALIKTVSGYAKHEKKIMEAVTHARASMLKGGNLDKRLKAGDELQSALGRLFAIAENYPNLKANENFLHMQTELSAIEDKVAYSRQFYNDSVMSYENATELFPGVFFFKMMGKSKKEYLKISEADKNMPKIEFEE